MTRTDEDLASAPVVLIVLRVAVRAGVFTSVTVERLLERNAAHGT